MNSIILWWFLYIGMALEEMIIPGHDTQQICLSIFIRNFSRLPFEAFYLSSFPDSLSISHGHSSELKNIHPHRSLGRSGRRHSTAGGRNVSRQYVSHFDRNTDRGHQTSTQRRLRGEYRQDDSLQEFGRRASCRVQRSSS